MRVRLKTKSIFLICIAITCAFMFLSSTQLVYASSYGSWTEGTGDSSSVYGIDSSINDQSSSGIPEDEIESSQKKKSYASKTASKMFMSGYYSIAEFMDGVGLSIDRVILGRLCPGETTAPFGFDLADGNIYGTIGAIVYSILRNFMFGILGIYFVYLLTSYLITGTGKGKADLKGAVYNFIFVFALLFAIPIAVDYMLLFRDSLINVIVSFTTGLSGASSFKGTNFGFLFYEKIIETKDFGFLLMGFLCMFGMIWLAWNYIKIAIQQAYLFGIFPLVAFKSFQDKGIIGKWFSQFFANMIVPMLDIIGFSILAWMVDGVIDVDKPGHSIYLMLVFFCIIPSRNYILQLFGAPIPGKGFNMLPLLLMAGRLFAHGSSSDSTSGGESSPNKMPSGSESANATSASSSGSNQDTIKGVGNGSSSNAEATANATGGMANSEINVNAEGASSSTGDIPVGESGTQESIGGELGESAPSGIEESGPSYESDDGIREEGSESINEMASGDGVIEQEAPFVENINETGGVNGEPNVNVDGEITGEPKELAQAGDLIPYSQDPPTVEGELSNVEKAEQSLSGGQTNANAEILTPETIKSDSTLDMASIPGSKVSGDGVDVGGGNSSGSTGTGGTTIGAETSRAGSSGGGSTNVGSSTNNSTTNETNINTHTDSGVSRISGSVNATGGSKDGTVRFTSDTGISKQILPEQKLQASQLFNDRMEQYRSLNKVSQGINNALGESHRNDYDFGTPAGKSIGEAYNQKDLMLKRMDEAKGQMTESAKAMDRYIQDPYKGSRAFNKGVEHVKNSLDTVSTIAGVAIGAVGVASTVVSGDANTVAGAAGVGVMASKLGGVAVDSTADKIEKVADNHHNLLSKDFRDTARLNGQSHTTMMKAHNAASKAVSSYNKGVADAVKNQDTSLVKVTGVDRTQTRPSTPQEAKDINTKIFDSVRDNKSVVFDSDKVKVDVLGKQKTYKAKDLTSADIQKDFKLDDTVHYVPSTKPSSSQKNKKG